MMRLKIFFSLLIISLLAGNLWLTSAQQDPNQDEEVRGTFITTRKTSTSKTTSSNTTARNKNSNKSTSSRSTKSTTSTVNKNKNSNTSTNAVNQSNTNNVAVTNALDAQAIGLGYTLYMRNEDGDAVRVDPAREFRNGDRIRVVLETNTDGFLYIFHTENDGPARMIFPDARLSGGDNKVQAHVPYEIPSSREQSEDLRWLNFYGNAGVERLYIVVTRRAVPNVPTGADLVKYCREDQSRCPWQPTEMLWYDVIRAAKARVHTTKSKTYGQAQTNDEREATTRGLGLDQSAPPPAVIRLNLSSNAGILVTRLDLVHK